MATSASGSGHSSLKDYLKRYESKTAQEEKKKKKKKKTQTASTLPGVLVVDEDPVWQKPVKLEEEEEEKDSADEKPLVDEDIEVKRMRRLELIRSKRAINAIAEDGSGWVSLSEAVDLSSNMSPPRRRMSRNDTPSPEAEGKDFKEDSDKGRRNTLPEADFKPSREEDTDLSTPRLRQRVNSNLSPPRMRRDRNDTPSPETELKHSKEDTDLSPPRQRQRVNSDLSPPRRRRARNDTPSSEPELKRLKEDTDISPPRSRRKRRDTPSPGPEISPPRRPQAQSLDNFGRRKYEMPASSDVYRRRGAHRGDSPGYDISPPRKSRKEVGSSGDGDLSPPRRSNENGNAPKERPKTGLITGRDMQEEIARTRKDDLLRFEQMDPNLSGKGAEPVYRGKKGERISKEEYVKMKQKVEEKPKEKKLEWGKGLAQKREAEARLQELELEKEKPFARTRDDPELDRMLKDRVRWGDPMAHLVKKKHSESVLPNLGDNEKMKESGFVIPQDIPSHSWIKRGLDAAPNRYGIRPGRHWDGVDRSNGFEKQMFKRLNEKQATEREAYLWSVSDM
ncbi:hypothetical protein K2173_019261 [Erythroxylum novogranatense]|uniref:BUD13 homolog n=1 Tax=Erythroxylum novogranatense TaxID=1862640 RepID=A0AAV8SU45_9ROSI|nr:hypothetical protein K2173_019261 [Erythroxylum novogranatense]